MLSAIVKGEVQIVEKILIKKYLDPNYIYHDYKVCYGCIFFMITLKYNENLYRLYVMHQI